MNYEQQYEIRDFKFKVKCCYNCNHWLRGSGLMFEYRYNFCDANIHSKPYNVRWDCCCDNYSGDNSLEENLLIHNLEPTQEYINMVKNKEDSHEQI